MSSNQAEFVQSWQAAMTADRQAVVLVAETMAKYARKRRFRRQPTAFDFVPIAREVVATLFLLPNGQRLSAEALAAHTGRIVQ